MSNVLVTGGLGYLGSHVVTKLLLRGHNPIIVDNLSNSKIEVLDGITKITKKRPLFFQGSVLDKNFISNVFSEFHFDAVMHFAGFKSVLESSLIPLEYYSLNVGGSLTILEEMKKRDIKQFIFSSSATVYGETGQEIFYETSALHPISVYGRSKLMVEDILRDFYNSNKDWSITILRYFNPVGAHPSGNIGEDPKGVPCNLMPILCKVAAKKIPVLKIFGGDYPTSDGTGARDYIHVMDLAEGHISALTNSKPGLFTFNLGTGKSTTVLELIHSFEKVTSTKVPYELCSRRNGDIASCYADPTLIKKELGWQAVYGIDEMCRDAWNWEKHH